MKLLQNASCSFCIRSCFVQIFLWIEKLSFSIRCETVEKCRTKLCDNGWFFKMEFSWCVAFFVHKGAYGCKHLFDDLIVFLTRG